MYEVLWPSCVQRETESDKLQGETKKDTYVMRLVHCTWSHCTWSHCTVTARSRGDESWNDHRNRNQNRKRKSSRSLFEWNVFATKPRTILQDSDFHSFETAHPLTHRTFCRRAPAATPHQVWGGAVQSVRRRDKGCGRIKGAGVIGCAESEVRWLK